MCYGPNILMRHHLMCHRMQSLWLCWRGDLPLHLKTRLGLQGRSWIFLKMISSRLFLWGQAWNRLICVLRHPDSSDFPSKRYSYLFSFLSNARDCGAHAYTFYSGLHFRPCGRSPYTTQTYLLWIKTCPFRCVWITILQGCSVCRWLFLGASYERN